jgi:hypothetical protein
VDKHRGAIRHGLVKIFNLNALQAADHDRGYEIFKTPLLDACFGPCRSIVPPKLIAFPWLKTHPARGCDTANKKPVGGQFIAKQFWIQRRPETRHAQDRRAHIGKSITKDLQFIVKNRALELEGPVPVHSWKTLA